MTRPPRLEHALHLAQCALPVGEELEAHLAEHDVERHGPERERFGARLVPLDRTAAGRVASDLEHARVDVDADDGVIADSFGGEPGHDTCAAGDVEHLLAGSKLGRARSGRWRAARR